MGDTKVAELRTRMRKPVQVQDDEKDDDEEEGLVC
jgi:hypothetical protein